MTEAREEESERIDRSVNAAARTLAILDAFIEHDGPLTLIELEAQTGLFKSVILRYMLSLESTGYVYKRADGRYQLGVRSYQLGCRYESSFNLGELVMPVLEMLTRQTQESSSLYIREGEERVCLLRKDSPQLLKASIPPGTRLPLDDTATAQAFKRFSDGPPPRWSLETCVCFSSGQSNTRIETARYTASMSAPVFRHDGTMVGVLTVAGPTVRFDPSGTESRLLLLQAAMDLSAALGCAIPAA